MIVDSRKVFNAPSARGAHADTQARALAERWRTAQHTGQREAVRSELRRINGKERAMHMTALVIKHLAFKDGNMVNASWFTDFMGENL